MADSRLLLVRHCQSSGQAPDAELTELGLEQARTLADFLVGRGVDMIVTSAYRRAQQSIAPFAATTGLAVHTDHRLNERTLSDRPIENWRELIRDSFDDIDLRASGGESAREVLERAWAGLTSILDGGFRLPLVVTHGNLMSLVFRSLDPSFGYTQWENLTNPDAYLVERREGQASFERVWRE